MGGTWGATWGAADLARSSKRDHQSAGGVVATGLGCSGVNHSSDAVEAGWAVAGAQIAVSCETTTGSASSDFSVAQEHRGVVSPSTWSFAPRRPPVRVPEANSR
jgi:hypothetical protein